MPYLQGQGAQGPTREHCGHTPLGTGSPQLSVPGTWKRPRRGCPSGNRPLYLICPSLHHMIPDHPDNHPSPQDQFHHPLWVLKKILLDQGRNFESQLVADLCKLMGTQKLCTSAYHPQTYSQCERFNSTLIGMLGMLPPEKKPDWKNHIGALVHAYNCTQNSATGFSPYYLMYGRHLHLPVDITLGLAPHSVTAPTTSKFVQETEGMSQMGP